MKIVKYLGITILSIFALIGIAYAYGHYLSKGYDQLQEAAQKNDIESASTILSLGVPPYPTDTIVAFDYFSHLENTPIQIAAEKGHYEMVKLLIDNGAIIDWCCCECVTALDMATRNNYVKVVELLIKSGARVRPDLLIE